jgi:putative chitinase
MIDRDKFFAVARASVFEGTLDQSQVDNLNAILDASPPTWDPRWLACALGNAAWETRLTMAAVREAYWLSEDWRKAHLRYWPFYGRGLSQCTWRANYAAFSAVLGVDLVGDPDKALDPTISAKILFYGMEHGTFTGRKLADYFTPTVTNFLGSRAIINGSDRAAEVAAYGEEFLAALS